MARILVTGATGFIGRALCSALAHHGHEIIAGLRRAASPTPGAASVIVGDIAPGWAWPSDFGQIDVVIHLAQQAHRTATEALSGEPAAAVALAKAAHRAGAARLLYMSSVKAMGEETPTGRPFRAADPPQPADMYGQGKLATEQALVTATRETSLELAIVRPPLVYGPGVRANFRALMRLVARGLPLPFAAIDNRRSLVFIDNLVDLTITAALHPAAAGGVWLVRDDVDLSTPSLVRALAAGLGRPARMFAVPRAAWSLLQAVPGLGSRLAPLTGSLQVDDASTRATFDWLPPVPAMSGLALTARSISFHWEWRLSSVLQDCRISSFVSTPCPTRKRRELALSGQWC